MKRAFASAALSFSIMGFGVYAVEFAAPQIQSNSLYATNNPPPGSPGHRGSGRLNDEQKALIKQLAMNGQLLNQPSKVIRMEEWSISKAA